MWIKIHELLCIWKAWALRYNKYIHLQFSRNRHRILIALQLRHEVLLLLQHLVKFFSNHLAYQHWSSLCRLCMIILSRFFIININYFLHCFEICSCTFNFDICYHTRNTGKMRENRNSFSKARHPSWNMLHLFTVWVPDSVGPPEPWPRMTKC